MRDQLLIDQVGVRFGAGGAVLFVFGAVVARGPLHGLSGVVLLLVVTALVSIWSDEVGALALGLAGWAFATGFAVNTLGVLTFASLDLLRLSGFVLAAAFASRLRPA